MADVQFNTQLEQLIEETRQIQGLVDVVRENTEPDWSGDLLVSYDLYEEKGQLLKDINLDVRVASHSKRLADFIYTYFRIRDFSAAFRTELQQKFRRQGYDEVALYQLKTGVDPQIHTRVNHLFTAHAKLESDVKLAEIECSIFHSLRCAVTIFSDDPDVINENLFRLGRGYANWIYVMTSDE